MRYSGEVLDFIRSQETVDFVVRGNDEILNYVQSDSKIVLGETLAGRYLLGYVDKAHYSSILSALGSGFYGSEALVLGTLGQAALEASGIFQLQQHPYLNLTGNGVLIGFVDTGIDYTLDTFRYEDGSSKIQYIYDQTARGTGVDTFLLGQEYTNEDINRALQADNPYSVVPQKDTSGHGTFLASAAAGRTIGDFIGAAPDAEIIMVKLRKARNFYLQKYCVPDSQEDAFESTSVMVGVEYIIAKARQLRRPVVICIGLGTNFGSHDGFTLFEEYLSGISNLRGVCLCTAMGNESRTRHHMQGMLTANEDQQDILFRVGEKAKDVCLCIWNNISDRFSVSVRSPSGEQVSRMPARNGITYDTQLIFENARVEIEYHFPVEGSGGQLTMVRILGLTPGIWNVTVYGSTVLDGSFHAWLPLQGFVSEDVEFLSPTPYYTAVVPATMIGAICCTAYDAQNNSLCAEASWGPVRSGLPVPDLAAPGVNVGGFYPYGYGAMSGTSVSAAITAGACALFLQWGIVNQNNTSLSSYQVRAYLIRGCARTETIDYPNLQWGYGMLDVLRAFQMMRE